MTLCEIKPGGPSAAAATLFSFPRKLHVTAGNVGGAGQSGGGKKGGECGWGWGGLC